jgi:hypothetical protein
MMRKPFVVYRGRGNEVPGGLDEEMISSLYLAAKECDSRNF